MSLQQWLNNGWLTHHQTSPQEIKDLLSIVDRDINDCQTFGLSNDWRFNIAYNAILQCAAVALAASGYRATREAHHFRTIQSLELTVNADKKLIQQIDIFRKKRNITGYDMAGYISDQESEIIVAITVRLKDQILQWLKKNYPDLVPE